MEYIWNQITSSNLFYLVIYQSLTKDLKPKLTKLMLVSFWFTFVKSHFNNSNQYNFITLICYLQYLKLAEVSFYARQQNK